MVVVVVERRMGEMHARLGGTTAATKWWSAQCQLAFNHHHHPPYPALPDRYPAGVKSVHDGAFQSKFESVYTSPALEVPWLMTIGNHDCLGDVSAQVEYTALSDKWEMCVVLGFGCHVMLLDGATCLMRRQTDTHRGNLLLALVNLKTRRPSLWLQLGSAAY